MQDAFLKLWEGWDRIIEPTRPTGVERGRRCRGARPPAATGLPRSIPSSVRTVHPESPTTRARGVSTTFPLLRLMVLDVETGEVADSR
jgi:hypothetical protein